MNAPFETGQLDWLPSAVSQFRYYKQLAERAVTQVPDEKLGEALDRETNSVDVIMRHIAGNLRSRWTEFLTSDGEKPWRERDSEFLEESRSRAAIFEHWERGWAILFASLEDLGPDELAQTVTIRGEPHSVPLAILRSLAHCAYHVGQIVQVARIHVGEDWTTLTMPRNRPA